MDKLKTTIIPPTGKTHSGTVILFHGSGDSGDNFIQWIRFILGRDLKANHLKFIFPSAPPQPFTPLKGGLSNIWFDRSEVNLHVTENRKSVQKMYRLVEDLIRQEIKESGIPAHRIIVGGYSMGGSLALHTAFNINRDLAGVFTCSSFLNYDSQIFDSLKDDQVQLKRRKLPKLLMFHGDADILVLYEWGQQTHENLLKHTGIRDSKFITVPDMMHEIKTSQLITIEKWINEIVPPLTSDLGNKL